jgi:hypothetical protein
MHERQSTAQGTARTAFTQRECLTALFIALALAAVLSPTLARVQRLAREVTCADNLHAIGQGMHIYANDNQEWFPIHYHGGRNAPPTEEPTGDPVYWIGTMGSRETLLISEPTSATNSPNENHPSRSLFLMIIMGTVTPAHFVCPNSRDVVDDLWNDGLDEPGPGVPGVNRFDFRGYNHLSYAYQLPYGRRGRPRESMDSDMLLVADKGPYCEGDRRVLMGTRTIHDRRSALDAPRQWVDLTVEEILALTTEWRPYNSPNHGGDGQNVLAVDGNVTFAERPIAGLDYDNIYTIQYSLSDPREVMIGVVPDADQAWAPLAQTDSFLVP